MPFNAMAKATRTTAGSARRLCNGSELDIADIGTSFRLVAGILPAQTSLRDPISDRKTLNGSGYGTRPLISETNVYNLKHHK
jgi:hypothetical protein